MARMAAGGRGFQSVEVIIILNILTLAKVYDVDGDDGASDDINDDDDDDMTLTTGHGMPCIWATLSQGTPCLPTKAEGHSI